ncbi:hypothetical protein UF75_0160 [Desulfosporosinus sp. I2]|nr:hypothetical protein UF75_0160 [Desulfosporosinus sp. I2]
MTILQKKLRENTSKALHMTGDLINVLRLMEESGIRAVVLKGIPLGYMLYSNLALRPSRDLDILVWPEDVHKAIVVIENQGYERIEPSSVVTPERLNNWMKTNHHLGFRHNDREIYLELHWRVGHYGIEIPLNEIESCLTQLTIAGQAMYIPGAEELLLFLMLHGASHAWFRLKWLCDIAVLLGRGGFSWERLYALAEHLGVEALLNQAVIFAHDLLQAPVPDNVVQRIMKDRKARNLVRMALPFIFSVNYEPANLTISMPLYFHSKKYEFSVQIGWKKKFAYLYKKLLPKDRDFELITLPESLYFLYYLFRPFNWLSRKVLELAGR